MPGVNEVENGDLHTSCDVEPSAILRISTRSWRARARTPGTAADTVRTRPGCPMSLRCSRSSSNSSTASPRPGTAATLSAALQTQTRVPAVL